MKEVIIDVRERDEFDAEHIQDSINVPLSTFDSQAPGILTQLMDRKLIIMCRSGNRAKMAQKQALALGFAPESGYDIFEGGILKWKEEGKKTVAKQKGRLPLMRQTHIGAGAIGLTGIALGYTLGIEYFAISAFVCGGLLFAGATGICMLTNVLAVMPWNKNVPGIKEEACVASSGRPNCGVSSQ